MDRRKFATRLSIFAAAFVPAVVRGQKPPTMTIPGGQKQGTGYKEVIGEAADKGHPGVYGYNFHGGDGVDGQTDSGNGVHGSAYNGNGVFGESKNGDGVYGQGGADGVGVRGGSSFRDGVRGVSDNGIGVQGYGDGKGGDVDGMSVAGVRGDSHLSNGVIGVGAKAGVRGVSESGFGVFGKSNGGAAVYGESSKSTAVMGVCENWFNGYAGVFEGNVKITKTLIIGDGILPDAVSRQNLAGYFIGNYRIKGQLIADSLIKSSGSFKIDHPLAPDKKYLSHSFVESPDMMNVYNGNVTTDTNGDATVMLPAYFAALNRDCRYQLTVIGQFAQAIVASKTKDNRFTIKTDKPNVEVSWQVTGIRQDVWANAHRIQVEEDKPAKEVGYYLHPELFGQPAEKGASFLTPRTDS